MNKCKCEWCNNKPNRSGKGYCRTHYDQIRKYGYVLNKRTIANPNEIIKYETYAEVIIRNLKQEEVARCVIDLDDIDVVSKYKWSLHNNGYVRGVHNKKTIYIHRIIMNANSEEEIDHINLDKLDNRKNNLRNCSHSQNCWNRKSTNKGIRVREDLNKKYVSRITLNGVTKHLGYFHSREEALAARIEAEKKYHGEYRCTV